MRLIDADALQEHFADMQHYERCACNFTDDGGEPATEWYCVEDALENAPTIDAIPVEWLCRIIRMEENCRNYKTAKYLTNLIWEWHMEANDETD